MWLWRSLNQELHKPGIGTNYCCALFACTVHVHVNVSVIKFNMYTSFTCKVMLKLHDGTANFQS